MSGAANFLAEPPHPRRARKYAAPIAAILLATLTIAFGNVPAAWAQQRSAFPALIPAGTNPAPTQLDEWRRKNLNVDGWVQATRTGDSFVFVHETRFDKSSYPIVHGWARWERFGNITGQTPPRSLMWSITANCSTIALRIDRSTDYTGNNLLGDVGVTSVGSGTPEEAAPGTVAEALVDALCKLAVTPEPRAYADDPGADADAAAASADAAAADASAAASSAATETMRPSTDGPLISGTSPRGNDWVAVDTPVGGPFKVALLPGRSVRKAEYSLAILRLSPNSKAEKLDPDSGIDIFAVVFLCKYNKSFISHIDSYDRSGTYLFSNEAITEKIVPTPLVDGSPLELVADMVCDPNQRPESASAPSAPLYSTGTGWLSTTGYIITASHVVRGSSSIAIFQDGKVVGTADVIADDQANDVAVLKPKFDTSPFVGLELGTGPLILGSKVFTMGYPLADELGISTVKMASGEISSLSGVDISTGKPDDPRFAQVSIPIQGGNSGGPVVAEDGKVVGIIISKKQLAGGNEITQNVNFALKSAYVAGLLGNLPVAGRTQLQPVDVSASNRASLIKGGIFLVFVTGVQSE